MAKVDYPRFRIMIDPGSKKVQGLKVGDVVRREYYDAPNLIYSLMVVVRAGTLYVGGTASAYIDGALLEGDEPVAGQILDFVRVTSLTDETRSGALYLTASDSDSPYMDVIDGLAKEFSLCYPTMGGGDAYAPDQSRYSCFGKAYVEESYMDEESGVGRIYRLTRTPQEGYESYGLKVGIGQPVANPQTILVSFRVRASKLMIVPVKFGYTDDSQYDYADTFPVGTWWEYKLLAFTIDYSSQYERDFSIYLTDKLAAGEWLEVAELNIVRLSDIAQFGKATKARVGKVKGVVDPVFGTLEGYGAYFQNLYATRNVNIAGTLTAGDGNGFSSTFYAGKIHKNVILNSLDPEFIGYAPVPSGEAPPTGIGKSWSPGPTTKMKVQSAEWLGRHPGETFCFSIWMKAIRPTSVLFYQNDLFFERTSIEPSDGWRRYYGSFRIEDAAADSLIIRINVNMPGVIISSPQLEAGTTPSQYQPTDGTLSYVEDYGAWFSKGGIGGTIQNPLLRLNEDGSICSRGGSFVINPDGTGHFASGRFRWTEDTITLRDFTLRWEDLSEDTRQSFKDNLSGSAALPDWVSEWDGGKTVIDGNSVVTPKIFTGIRNANGTITGVALGHYTLLTRNAAGQFQSEAISGIYGFRDGNRTFAIDISGSVEIGRGDNSIRYNSATGKIEFGAAVAMQWAGATRIDADGVFTGTLSADTISAIRIDASQITAGTIDTARLNVADLKAELVTAGNIEALTLNVVRGSIGCWSIDADSIFSGTKSNAAEAFTSSAGSVTIGSNGIRGYGWRLDSSGAGALAGGNIVWDASGNVTFASSVSIQWRRLVNEALSEAIDHSGRQITNTIKSTSDMVAAAKELATAMAYGRMLYRDPTFLNGLNGITVYNLDGGDTVTHTREPDNTAPNDSGTVLRIQNTGTAFPYCGGFTWKTPNKSGKTFIARIIARIPVGRSIIIAQPSMSGGIYKWLTPTSGTGEWQEYIHKVVCGTSGNTTHWFYLDGTAGTPSAPVKWDIAYATVFDITSSERLTTTIDADGIYTGTLTARQVNAVDIDASSITTGYLSSGRILAGSITADKVNVASLQAGLITTGCIEGLTLNFTKGKIGDWTIAPDSIMTGDTASAGSTAIHVRTAASGSGAWYRGEYKPCGFSLLWHQTGNAGHIVVGQVAASGTTVKTGFWGIQMMSWDHQEYFCLAANTTRSGSKEIYNRIAGWIFDHQQIYKGNVCLGSDGSIYNGTKWRLNSDGSGQVAGGNISWDASGAVTFAAEVSLNWTRGLDDLTTALGGSTYRRLTYIGSTGIYTGTLTADQINVTGIDASNITTGTLSADRIAAGCITADKLNVGNLQASLVTVGYIEGLTLKFKKGTIGGWTIGFDDLSSGDLGVLGATAIQLRTTSIGSGYWYYGAFLPAGVTLTWRYGSNGGHIVMGQVAANAYTAKSGYYGIQLMDRNSREYFCLAAETTGSSVAVYNRIAGWAFDYQAIWKNNVYLGSDGSLYNGSKWQLNNDGSGQIANGNISWNASGTVTFSSSVSLSWRTPISDITSALGGSNYTKLTYIGSTGIYTGSIMASQVTVDSTLVVGGGSYNGSISVRNASNTVMVTLNRTGITAVGGKIGGWTLTSNALYSGGVYLDSAGSIYNGSYWRLSSDGSGLLASGRISWNAEGVLTVKNVVLQDAVVKGTLRSPFVRADGAIHIIIGGGSQAEITRPESEKYDNLCIIAGSNSGGWTLSSPVLPWNIDQSGRRLVLTHYRYNSEIVSGTCTFTAPSGYYFYEYGRQSTTLRMSRETIELMGYGTSTEFYGWIVLNRRDLFTEKKYGAYSQYLAMGTVTYSSSTSATLKYKTYDGSSMSVTKSGTGVYYVYLPWSLGSDAYMVMLTGRWSTKDGVPIYATVKSQYASHFCVQTQDDPSANEGSFNFVVISTADFR